jgi:hypothetical protein
MEDETFTPDVQSGSSTDYEQLLTDARSEAVAEQPRFDPKERAQLLIAKQAEKDETHAGKYGPLGYLERDTTPADQEAMREQAKMREPVSKIAIRLDLGVAEKILIENQPYQALAESKMTNALEGDEDPDRVKRYAEHRNEVEAAAGIHQADDEPRVIYGFLEETDSIVERQQAENYGSVEVILKSEVVDRSTFTTGDSLNTAYWPIGFEDAVYARQLKDMKNQKGFMPNMGDGGYVEAQIFGGVSKSDIEQIVISGEATQRKDREGNFTTDELTPLLAKADALRAAAPDVEITLRLDIKDTFSGLQMIEYANAHRDTQIALYMDAKSPFLRERFLRRGMPEADSYGTAGAVREQQEGRERVGVVKGTLELLNESKTGTEALPTNLSVHMAVSNY